MASSRDNNNQRRPLPRVNGNMDNTVKKALQEAQKEAAKNAGRINNLEDESRANTQTINQLKDRITKAESENRKNEQENQKLQRELNRVDVTATNAERASTQNQKDIKGLQKATVANIQSSIAKVSANFTGSLNNVNNSFTNINDILSQSSAFVSQQNQDKEARLVNVEQQVELLRNDVTKVTQTLENTASDLIELNDRQDESIQEISDVYEEFKEDQLDREKEKEKALRIETANKRRDLKENILEGANKAIRKTGSALANTTRSMLGGFNLIDAIKSTLAKLLLGIAVVKFPAIYKNIEENIGKWKRAAALVVDNLLKPLKSFIGFVVDVSAFVVKSLFKGLKLAANLFGKIINFGSNLALKALRVIKDVLIKIGKLAKNIFRPGAKVAQEAVTSGNRGASTATNAVTDAATSRPAVNAATDVIVDRTARTAADAATEVVPKKNWAQRLGDSILSGARYVDNNFLGGNIGKGINFIKKPITDLIDQAKKFLSPLKAKMDGAKSMLDDAFKKGPDAVRAIWGKVMKPLSGMFNNLMSNPAFASIMGKLGGLTKRAIATFGKGTTKNFMKGISRSNPLATFPIDLLLNKFLMGYDDTKAFQRATGSTLGSVLGGGLGAVLFQGNPVAIAGGSFLGGEVGDLIAAVIRGDSLEDTSYALGRDIINAVGGWFNEDVSNVKTESDGAISEVATTSPMSKLGGTGSVANLTGNNQSTSISPTNTAQAIAQTPVNQLYRAPSRRSGQTQQTGTTGSPEGNGGSSNMTSITMPAQAMEMPTQVIGDSGETLDKTPAQKIPSISPTNPAMDYLQVAAAETFGMQLV